MKKMRVKIMSDLSSNISNISNISNTYGDIFVKQLKDSSISFVKGMPLALVILPLILLLTQPNMEKAMYLGGSLFVFVVASLFINKGTTGTTSFSFDGNYISFYGIVLGFFMGNIFLQNMYAFKLGNILSTFVLSLNAVVLTAWVVTLDNTDETAKELGSTLIGLFIGGAIGIFFAHLTYNLRNKKDKNEKTETVCRTYEDGILVDEQRT